MKQEFWAVHAANGKVAGTPMMTKSLAYRTAKIMNGNRRDGERPYKVHRDLKAQKDYKASKCFSSLAME